MRNQISTDGPSAVLTLGGLVLARLTELEPGKTVSVSLTGIPEPFIAGKVVIPLQVIQDIRQMIAQVLAQPKV